MRPRVPRRFQRVAQGEAVINDEAQCKIEEAIRKEISKIVDDSLGIIDSQHEGAAEAYEQCLAWITAESEKWESLPGHYDIVWDPKMGLMFRPFCGYGCHVASLQYVYDFKDGIIPEGPKLVKCRECGDEYKLELGVARKVKQDE